MSMWCETTVKTVFTVKQPLRGKRNSAPRHRGNQHPREALEILLEIQQCTGFQLGLKPGSIHAQMVHCQALVGVLGSEAHISPFNSVATLYFHWFPAQTRPGCWFKPGHRLLPPSCHRIPD